MRAPESSIRPTTATDDTHPIGAPAASRQGASVPAFELVVLLAIMVVWGSLHTVGKIALQEVSSTGFAFSRTALSGAFLLVVCLVTGRMSRLQAEFRPVYLPGLSALSLAGFVGSTWMSMTGLSYLPAGVNSLLSNTSPLMVALVGALVLRERTSVRALLGISIGFVGVSMVVLGGGAEAAALPIVGVVFSLSGAAGWATYTAIGRRMQSGHDFIALTAAASLLGSIPLGLGVYFEGGFALIAGGSERTWLLLLYGGVIATGVTHAAWVYVLRRVRAANVSVFQYLIPVVALAAAYLLLGEEPSWWVLGGAGLIISGVAVASSRNG